MKTKSLIFDNIRKITMRDVSYVNRYWSIQYNSVYLVTILVNRDLEIAKALLAAKCRARGYELRRVKGVVQRSLRASSPFAL